jgi:hypothetical protein
LAKQDRTAEAIEEYHRALDRVSSPDTVLDLAIALERSDRRSEAIAQYQRFLSLVGEKDPDRAKQVSERLGHLRASSERRPR